MNKLSLAYWVGKLVVKLHYQKKLDIWALCSIHEPEMWSRGQRKAKIPNNVKWDVWRRDGFRCHYCGVFGHNLSLDHMHPESAGGFSDASNLITACSSCNRKKGSRSYEEFTKSKWLTKKRLHISTTAARAQTRQAGQVQTSSTTSNSN